jgi:ATP-dependent Zn protease
VTKQARAMVTIYGLNDKLGNITYYDSQGQNEYAMDKPYSQETAVVIDEEISKIIEAEYDRAIDILSNNREKLDALANLLLDKEVIFKENVEEIFGKRPWDKEEIEDTTAEEVATEETTAVVEPTEPTEAPAAEETPKEAE